MSKYLEDITIIQEYNNVKLHKKMLLASITMDNGYPSTKKETYSCLYDKAYGVFVQFEKNPKFSVYGSYAIILFIFTNLFLILELDTLFFFTVISFFITLFLELTIFRTWTVKNSKDKIFSHFTNAYASSPNCIFTEGKCHSLATIYINKLHKYKNLFPKKTHRIVTRTLYSCTINYKYYNLTQKLNFSDKDTNFAELVASSCAWFNENGSFDKDRHVYFVPFDKLIDEEEKTKYIRNTNTIKGLRLRPKDRQSANAWFIYLLEREIYTFLLPDELEKLSAKIKKEEVFEFIPPSVDVHKHIKNTPSNLVVDAVKHPLYQEWNNFKKECQSKIFNLLELYDENNDTTNKKIVQNYQIELDKDLHSSKISEIAEALNNYLSSSEYQAKLKSNVSSIGLKSNTKVVLLTPPEKNMPYYGVIYTYNNKLYYAIADYKISNEQIYESKQYNAKIAYKLEFTYE